VYFIDQGTKHFRRQFRKFKHIGTIAEVIAFRSNYERPDIAYCHFVKCLTELLIKSTAYLVVRRICQCNESNVAIFFKTKRAHLSTKQLQLIYVPTAAERSWLIVA